MIWILHRRNTRIRAGLSGLRILIGYWLGWPVFVFMVFWTLFNASYSVNVSTDQTIYLQKAFSILGFAVMIWLLFGREAVTFHEHQITVFRGIFGIGRYRNFSLLDVHDMRVGTSLDPRAGGKWDPSFVRATICFECREKTQRFGNELSQFDAGRILEAIRQHHPQLVYNHTDVPVDGFRDQPLKRQTALRPAAGAGPNPIVILLFALWILWAFGFETVGARLQTQVDGVVTSSRDIPATRGPRYATEYTLRGPDGQDHIYVAGPTDASLPRSMPVGTYLKKRRWHLYFERNEQRVDDFPLFFYQVALGIALGCVVLSAILWRGRRQAK